MRTFQDSAGRTWTLAITVDALKRVAGLVPGVQLANLTAGDPPLLTRLETDVVLLCDVIFALVQPQAEQQRISDEEFGRALGGEAITAAHDAFWQELTDFFRQLRRTDTVRAIEKQNALVQATVAAVERQVAALDVEMLVRELAEQRPSPPPGSGSGSWPGSSVSTPGP